MAKERNTDIVALLADLVGIPSVNPEDTHDDPVTGEGRLAEYVAGYLEHRAFEVEWDERASGRPNLIASYGPNDARRIFLLEAHLDTVGIQGMTRAPFDLVEEEGRLYGRGACDTKGPMAAALWAFQPAVLDRLAQAGWRLLFVGAMGEEKGHIGAERLVERGLVRADEAVVLEPTGLTVVRAHKGSLWFSVEVEGRAGHGSDPDAGVNAIDGMQAVIDLVHKEVFEQQALHHDSLLGESTVSIGTIHGGAAVNVIAAGCSLEVDRRTLPSEAHAEILGRVRAGLEALAKDGALVAYELRTIKDSPPFVGCDDSVLAARFAGACAACGVTSRDTGTAWFSDAGPLSRVCPDVVVFGPGHIAQAHTADEYIERAQLEKGGAILHALLDGLAESE